MRLLMLLACLLLVSTSAFAQTNSTVDLSPVRDALLALVAAVITGCLPIIMAWLSRHFSILQDAQMNLAIAAAASRAGATLVTRLRDVTDPLTKIDVHSDGLSGLVRELMANYPDFTQKLGLTPEKAAVIIVREAEKLLAPATLVVPAPVPMSDEAAAVRSSGPLPTIPPATHSPYRRN